MTRGTMSHEDFVRRSRKPDVFTFKKTCEKCSTEDEDVETEHTTEEVMDRWRDESIDDEDLGYAEITMRMNGDTESIERCTVCGHEERVL